MALAYLMHKTTHVFPILGVRSIEQLKENASALDIHLTAEHITYLEGILPFEWGAPHDNIVSAFMGFVWRKTSNWLDRVLAQHQAQLCVLRSCWTGIPFLSLFKSRGTPPPLLDNVK